MNDVADVHLTHPGNPIDRRGQAGVAELDICRLDQGLVGFDGALQLRHLRRLCLDQLRGGPTFLAELGVAAEIGLGVCKLGLIAIARGRHLVDLRLVGPRIDLCEEITRMHGLPFIEGDLGDLPLDLAAHQHRVVGDDRTDAAQIDRHVLAADHTGDDGYRWYRRWRQRRSLDGRPMPNSDDRAGCEDGNQQRSDDGKLSAH